MSSPFIGEIRMFGGSFAPAGWAFCQGSQVPISENDTLFNLIGTTYGGDGQEYFNLPDLSGRVPIHQGQGPGISQNYQLGTAAGVESVTLSTQQLPVHNHAMFGNLGNGAQASPSNNILASSTLIKPYAAETPDSNMAPGALTSVGGSQPHENMQPYLAVSFIISLFGIFPHQ